MLPAVEVQQAWSRSLGVNLLAANAGLAYSHAGSGIYSKGTALAVHYNPRKQHDDRLLVAQVPKLRKHALGRAHARGRVIAPPVPAAAFREFGVLSSTVNLSQVVTVSSGGFVCHLAANISKSNSLSILDRYLLVAVNGSWMGRNNLPSRSCVVVRCGNLSEQACADRVSCARYTDPSCPEGRSLYNTVEDLSASTVFESIMLRANFLVDDLVLPMVGTHMGQLVEKDKISFSKGSMHVTLEQPLLNAMLFAIPNVGKIDGSTNFDQPFRVQLV